jgi:DNA-binding NarL/FixJ family response regulator
VTRILLVDDHPLFRDGFGQMATRLRPEWSLYFADNAAQALAIFAMVALDLAIVDVSLPGEDGFALFKAIANLSRLVPQILISGRDDAAVRIRARASGARSFISKAAAPETVISTIDAVLRGETVFDTAKGEVIPALTARQMEILMLVAAGHGNKEIRHRLNIAERTVRAHLTELFNVLGVHSRMQALIRARELGLIA